MASTLGKRKDRDEEPSGDAKVHGSTLFVSNLPYTATSVDLQTLFSDIGPVKSAFVVTEQGTGLSKGVGYVSFAMKEDAESAFETIGKGELSLAGRALRADWAGKKPKTKPEATEKKASKPRPQPRHPTVHDPLAIRTIVVSGLPSSIDSKVLWKKVRKYQGAEKVEWPAKINDEEDPSIAHVVFAKPSQAQDAVSKLHAHVFKGSLLSVTLKKRLDNLSKQPIPTVSAKSSSTPSSSNAKGKGVAAPSHASRLIVRNIPFNATDQDLRAVFLPYGPIYSIHIPTDDKPTTTDSSTKKEKEEDDDDATLAESSTSPRKPQQPRTKGFAFVWMLSKKDAERAIEGCNGMTLHAGTAESLISDKQKKKKQKRLEKKLKEAAASKGWKEGDEGEEGEANEQDDEKEEQEGTQKNAASSRVIAVDWALSKDKWEKEKAKIEEEMKDEEEDEEEDESDDEDKLGVHEGSDDDDEEQTEIDEYSDRDEDDDEEAVKPQLPPPATGITLFIRNIPYEATEDELRTLFRTFGPLRYARITMDHATGRSRGTGFACFWNIEDADRVIQQSELLRSETIGQTPTQPKKNPFSLPSILTPDPSASLAQSLVLHGRTLDVVRAVTRDEASKLKETNERAREKADKRNTYLLREGVILPNTPAAATLTPADVERRTQSFNARRALLKSNPSLFISKTRLSVRQIPLFVSERMLKKLAIHAIKAFEKEVKAGTRDPLTSDELAVDAELAAAAAAGEGEGEGGDKSKNGPKQEDDDDAMDVDQPQAKSKKFKEKFRKGGPGGGMNSTIRQAKIVRQAERVDPLSGKGKSKGYGFIEMGKHSDALRFLRWANNGAEVHGLFESWRKEDLEVMLKSERAKAEGVKDEARIERLKKEIEECEAVEGKKMKNRGGLIVEFSIENVQVVQRRKALADKDKAEPAGPSFRAPALKPGRADRKSVKKEEGDESRSKKRKLDTSSPSKAKKDDNPDSAPKTDPKIASLIGRKRKERKMGKGKAGKK